MRVGERTELGRRRFPPRAASVGEARRMIRDSLVTSGREDLLDTAELLVSEIVTNALVHAGTAIDVGFSFVDDSLEVEVGDGSPHAPTPRGYGPNAGTGRGLMLLDQMAVDWGVVSGDPGKTVWFRIAADEDGRGASPRGRAERRPPQARDLRHDTLDVQLVDVPLLLHEAWRQHAESLLREHLLASLDLDSAEDAILVHAEASDAISVLAEHIPPSGIGDDPDEVMVAATEPFVTQPLVSLRVPHGSVSHFETLDRTIRKALQQVENGEFLTPPIQPELQALRAWLCGEVRRQSAGGPSSAWSPLDEPPPQFDHALTWNVADVNESATAVIAADDADRIIAVSRAALELLGYADRAELVGTRLVTIIPARFRQAHLAGFTMHLLSGRAPLIDRTVVVPALRRDGSEVEVSLTIHGERTEEGRKVFVADLTPAESARLHT